MKNSPGVQRSALWSSAKGPRNAAITADDHGALLAMTTWFLGCILVLCTGTRLAVRFTTQRLPGLDDVLIVVAAAFAIGSTISISFAVESGLGKRSYLLTLANVTAIQKEMYAATILYILTVGVSKFSITVFLYRLACSTFHKVAVVLLSIVVVCWTVAITAGVIFECELPRPWEVYTGKCIPVMLFWFTASIVDIVTDLVMILLPIHIVGGLQIKIRKKALVIFIFTIRSVLIAISIVRLVYLTRFMGEDPAYDSIPYGIATQCHSTLSIIVACSPALKPFMDNVRTGMLSISLANRSPGTTFGQCTNSMQAQPKNITPDPASSKSKRQSKTASGPTSHPDTQENIVYQSRSSSRNHVYIQNYYGQVVKQTLNGMESGALVSSPGSRSPPRPPPPPEELRPDLSMFIAEVTAGSSSAPGGSQSDGNLMWSRGSQKKIIKKTRQWDVSYDDYHAP